MENLDQLRDFFFSFLWFPICFLTDKLVSVISANAVEWNDHLPGAEAANNKVKTTFLRVFCNSCAWE